MPHSANPLQDQFGPIDIYLFDQLLRGRIAPGMRILDAGCGSGRNLVYFLRSGYEVFASDQDADSIRAVQQLARTLAPGLPTTNFRMEPVERPTFDDGFAQVVLGNAVLHFARDEEQFDAMVQGLWRLLEPDGLFFCRLASTIGMESRMRPMGGRRFLLPDGTERYLVDEPMLLELTRRLGGTLLDPLKTTVVQDQRCMTTWVVRKGKPTAEHGGAAEPRRRRRATVQETRASRPQSTAALRSSGDVRGGFQGGSRMPIADEA